MGLLVRVVEYVHTPSLEIETSDGVKYTLESGSNGSLVIRSGYEMFAEIGKPHKVVIRQLRNEK